MDLSQQTMAQPRLQDEGISNSESSARLVGRRKPSSTSSEVPDSRAESLSRIIESQIIPRLMLAHRAAQGLEPLPSIDACAPGPEQIAEFANLVLSSSVNVAAAYIDAQRENGLSLESVYIDLLSPTARHLGYLWDNDLCDFTEVTAGLWRLQQLLHELSPAFQGNLTTKAALQYPAGLSKPKMARRALLVPAPGDQHTFGLFMVSEFFRRAGWDVWGELPTTTEQMISMVREEHFDMVGFSVGSELKLEELKFAIKAVRLESCNENVTVMVGGAVFMAHPDYVGMVGADMMAADGRDAVTAAESWAAQFEVSS